jgi:hypothetical protein
MPTEQILALLIAERDKLSRAIDALQAPTKRRGRPPKKAVVSTADYSDPTMPDWVRPAEKKTPARKKRTFTAAQRKAFGERMKAYWAAKKKAEAKSSGKAKKKAKAA